MNSLFSVRLKVLDTKLAIVRSFTLVVSLVVWVLSLVGTQIKQKEVLIDRRGNSRRCVIYTSLTLLFWRL